jgi:hypothetical protein
MAGNFINIVAFQIGWWCSAVGAGRGWTVLGPAVVVAVVIVHLVRSSDPLREAKFLAAVAVVGTVVDSFFAASGLLAYQGGYGMDWIAPAWITGMWLNFGTTIHASMGWLSGRPVLAAALGAIGGPLTYLAGARLGAAELLHPQWSLIALGIAWAVVLPFLYWISKKM